ncbi:rust resistance kinase Lr10-like isoform X2 [Malus sylvestris]|uniref:rust resistance kinase Lr10-like isoform X2 n=1 Tax=Malus sylvestris TaxID=3752 RepID=UPI0021ACE60D|nr:rust resistance kinase Lr10-like isoform X2 [Malus sylvestris]
MNYQDIKLLQSTFSLDRMLLINFLCCFLMIADAGIVIKVYGDRVAPEKCTEVSNCEHNGPAIRFPFRLKGKPLQCGYHGFVLSCTNDNQTVLEMPSSSNNLIVETINYASQEIGVYFQSDCPPTDIFKFNLSSSTFQFVHGPVDTNFTLFSCPSPLLETGCLIKLCPSGLDIPDNQTYYYAVDGRCSIGQMNLVSCTKQRDYTSVPDISSVRAYTPLMLQWSKPSCRRCEEMGKTCRLKRTIGQYNFTDNETEETECVSEDSTRGRTSLEISGIFTFSVVVTVVGTLIYRVYSSNKIEKTNQLRIERFLDDYIAHKPSRYSYADIKRITNQFNEKLGQGAYGTVYKGQLSSDLLVAVKILNNSNEKGEDFINEVGTMGRVHHVNVVRLVGFCADGYTTALVYEYLPNGSLQNILSSADSKSAFLGWDKLHEIALGIAKGIEYLHQGCDHRILHFDIKPHNILLDQNFTPKVSDFGLAKLCSRDQSAISMTTIRGNMGYIAPEVFSRNFGNVSYRSDVYSFGMLLLEMVGRTKNFKFMEEDSTSSQVYFPEWIYNLLEQGDDLRIHIEDGGDAEHAKKLAIVGLWCVQWHPIDRPSMKVVIQMLEGEGDNLTVPANPFRSTSN